MIATRRSVSMGHEGRRSVAMGHEGSAQLHHMTREIAT